jgi:hypothetical protein
VTQSTTPQEKLSSVVKTQEKQAKVAPKKIAEAMKKETTPQKISQSLAKKEKGSIVDGTEPSKDLKNTTFAKSKDITNEQI